MEYQLSLSPDIQLSPADFVAVWNVTTECRAAAEAHLLSHNHIQLTRREDLEVTTRMLEHLVKEVLRREGVSGATVTVQDAQDGKTLITALLKDK